MNAQRAIEQEQGIAELAKLISAISASTINVRDGVYMGLNKLDLGRQRQWVLWLTNYGPLGEEKLIRDLTDYIRGNYKSKPGMKEVLAGMKVLAGMTTPEFHDTLHRLFIEAHRRQIDRVLLADETDGTEEPD